MELRGDTLEFYEGFKVKTSGKPYFTAPEKVGKISFKKILIRPATSFRKTRTKYTIYYCIQR